MHTSWSRFCIVNHQASATFQHKVPGPIFEPATSDIEGEHSNCYITEGFVSNLRVGLYLYSWISEIAL